MRSLRHTVPIFLAALSMIAAGAAQSPQSKTTAASSKATADIVIRAGAIHTMAQGGQTMRAIAIGGGRILAVGMAAHDLDGYIGSGTQVIDDSTLTLLPGFIDTHTHLIFAAG